MFMVNTSHSRMPRFSQAQRSPRVFTDYITLSVGEDVVPHFEGLKE